MPPLWSPYMWMSADALPHFSAEIFRRKNHTIRLLDVWFLWPDQIQADSSELPFSVTRLGAFFCLWAHFFLKIWPKIHLIKQIKIFATFCLKNHNFWTTIFSVKSLHSVTIFSVKSLHSVTIFSGKSLYSVTIFSGKSLHSVTIFLGKSLHSVTIFSGKSLHSVTIFSGKSLYSVTIFSGKSLHSVTIFSVKSLHSVTIFSGKSLHSVRLHFGRYFGEIGRFLSQNVWSHWFR
jgi:hypothetical protein